MKKSFFSLIVFLLLASVCISQTPNFNAFVDKYKGKSNVSHVNLDGWIVRLGGKFIEKDNVNNLDLSVLFKGIEYLNLLVFDDKAESPSPEDVSELLESAHRSKFEDLAIVRSGKQRVNILIQETNNVVHDILFVVSGREKSNNSRVFLNLKGDFAMSDINRMIKNAEKN